MVLQSAGLVAQDLQYTLWTTIDSLLYTLPMSI